MNLSLLERLERSLTCAGLEPGARLLVGFSGGRDSVVLVELLLRAGWDNLVLCHLDHGLRAESAQDAAWAQQRAEGLGLGFCGHRVDVAAVGKVRHLGLEEAGREARYEFFERTALELDCPRVVLAHHADDQVETFLFRLLRGSGSTGLGGMAAVSARKDGKLHVLRPMLGIWRREIDAVVQARQLEFREDLSNSDLRWTRNRIRHELLPEMERVMQRPVAEALWRASEILRAESEWLGTLESEMGECPPELRVAELRGLPVALQRRRVLSWLRGQGVCRIGFEEVELVLGLLSRIRPARVNLPGGLFIRRRSGLIFLDGLQG